MNPGLPFPTTLPADHDPREHIKHVHTLAPNDSFHFSVILPRSWVSLSQAIKLPSADAYVTTLARYRHAAAPLHKVTVYASEIRREISGADWLTLFLEQRGFEILTSRRVPADHAGDRIDVLTRRIIGQVPMLSRWYVLKDGGDRRATLMIIEACVPEADYVVAANQIFSIVGSFAGLNATGWPFAERLRTLVRRTPHEFVAYYPQSWIEGSIQDHDETGEIGIDVLQNTIGDETAGQITLLHTTSSDGLELLDHTFSRLLPNRILHVQLKPFAEVARIANFERVWTRVGLGYQRRVELDQSLDPDAKFDIRVVVGQRGSAWHLIGLMGLARAKIPAVAAINERAFDIVVRYSRSALG